MKNILATICDTVSRRQQVAVYLYSHAFYDENSHMTYYKILMNVAPIRSVTLHIMC